MYESKKDELLLGKQRGNGENYYITTLSRQNSQHTHIIKFNATFQEPREADDAQ